MRSVTLPLLMFCLGLAACSGDGGRRPSTCEVISPPDVMVPTEQNRQRVEQQSSGDPTRRTKAGGMPVVLFCQFLRKGLGIRQRTQ